MNIGKWIVVSFVLFAAFIGTLVTVCVREDISLVSTEYYKEELDYQNQIQRINNTSQLGNKPVVRVAGNTLEVEFRQSSKIEKGEVKLFCPSNSQMDRTFKLQFLDQPVQSFKLDVLKKGMYKAKLFWIMNGKEYYQEDIINI